MVLLISIFLLIGCTPIRLPMVRSTIEIHINYSEPYNSGQAILHSDVPLQVVNSQLDQELSTFIFSINGADPLRIPFAFAGAEKIPTHRSRVLILQVISPATPTLRISNEKIDGKNCPSCFVFLYF